MGCCVGLIKVLIVLLNTLFLLTGLLIAVGTAILFADPTYAVSVVQDTNNYYIGLSILLVIGLILVIVAFLGCCGAFKESQCLLVTFFIFLLVVVVSEIAAGAWAFHNKDKLSDVIRSTVKHTVQEEYSVYSTRTVAFDGVQKMLKCCGAEGPNDWAASRFNNVERSNALDLTISRLNPVYKVPKSCCSTDDENVCNNVRSLGIATSISSIPTGIYSKGCLEKLIDTISEYSIYFMAVGGSIIVLELFGLIFSLVLCCAIRRNEDYKS
ncbi:CD9 antigen [Culicoides brevitarsis]|uniref:CD9 antigen n=1 Tax=Culicoides brevitarsis TaxID=469753 RepID=UPI00307BB23E